MSGRNRRTVAAMTLLMAAGLLMLAASVYVLVGEKGISVSPALWNIAVALCRAVTGVFGLVALVSAVTGRGSASSRDDILSAAATGVIFIAAAIAGLGLVIVITGLGGLGVLYAGVAVAVAAFRSGRPEPVPSPQRGEASEPVRLPALPSSAGRRPSACDSNDWSTTQTLTVRSKSEQWP